MDRHGHGTLECASMEPIDPAREGSHGRRRRRWRNSRTQLDDRMTTGHALTEPGPSSADCDLDSDHWFEPVDVWAVE
jgi:hypothetical protein